MTDADRLRQAAYRIMDGWCVFDGKSIQIEPPATYEIAALLRAVALMQEEYLDNTGNPRIFKALPIYNTAHALADKILGDSDE